MKYCFLLILVSILPIKLLAQTDTLFWFAVPYATTLHDPPLTANITLTATDEDDVTTVTISQPYNPSFSPITVTIDPVVSLTESVNFTQAEILQFSNNLYNTVTNSALLIHSDREITAYYEINKADNNPAIFALKGRNALGYDFWTPFQNQWNNHTFSSTDPAFSQIIIVATEDNTKVTVNFKKAAYGYAINTDYDIWLDKGQTYMFVPRLVSGVPSVSASDRLVGTHITSTKPISVTINDDSVEKETAYDDMGDQHIPVTNINGKSVIGYEYVVMKGKISDVGSGNNEKAYVLTTKNNTSITVTKRDGTITTYGPYAAGYQLALDMLTSNNDFYLHISATEPVYVLHIAGFGHELGDAVLPTIDGCTGSLSVSFVRSKNQDFYLNLMTKVDAIDSFYISINGSAPVHFLDGSYFEQAGSSDWYVLKDANKLISNTIIPTGAVTRITNTKNVFHLGYFNGVTTGGGCVYGYFSDYSELEAFASVEDQGTVFQVCGADSIQLKAEGGLSYHWTPTEYLDDPNIQNPILRPPHDGFSQVFAVDIEQPCDGHVTKYVYVIVPETPNAFITVDYDDGCAPFSIEMKDASSAGATDFVLDLGDGTGLISSSSPINLTHTYSNTTDTIVNYKITYTVGNADGCYDYYEDTLTIYPQIISDFKLNNWNDSTICNGTEVTFDNLSTGHTGTYEWHFGDGSTSSNANPSVNHTYTKYGQKDTVYHAYLIASSPYGCTDTSDIINIRVYPYIYTTFTIDSALICSPANLFIDPRISVGVDTFYYSFYDVNNAFYNNSVKKLTENPFVFSYSNTKAVPDTIVIDMYGMNRYGCTDTATSREIIIYPLVQANFALDQKAVCDSVGVLITNNSIGYNLTYEWDFGNGTSKVDNSTLPFTRYFLNRTDKDTVYAITLITTSEYICSDTISDSLTVHPFINANFALDYSDNCSPLNAEFINTSIGGDVYDWDFGDGSIVNTASPNPLYHKYTNNTDHDTTFYIKLTATNLEGCVDSAKRSISLFSQVVADFSFSGANEGCTPLEVTLTNNSKGTNLIYNWDFGDKTYSASQNPPPKTYKNSTANDSTYYITLQVMNLAGCDSSISHPVKVYSNVTADFSIERVDSCSPFKIAVHNFSSGGITDFIWQYTNTESIVLHDFSDPDIPVYRNQTLAPISYPFVLTTQNAHGCQAQKSDIITVFPEVKADFHPDVTAGCQPLPINLTNNTNIISGTIFYWNFGDGQSSNLISPPEHIYNNITNVSKLHNIHLEATSQYGCYDDTTITIEVYPYIYARFTIDRSEICSDEYFNIDRSGSSGAINHYFWDYQSDGITDEDKTDSSFPYTYSNTGSTNFYRDITLTVTNPQGCDTSWTESIIVHPEVRAAFSVDDEEICYPAVSSFTNLSEPNVSLTYYWDFGDGSTSAAKNPTHKYMNYSRTTDQTFTAILTATSEYGCDSTVEKNILVHPKPKADFSYPLSVDCPPFEVLFTNNSLGTNLSYLWNFDNGNTSTETNPEQVFYNNGSATEDKNITLITLTAYGCSDTMVRTISTYPDVEVDFDASIWSGCNPLDVDLIGTATNENEYFWFVNGENISNYQNPYYRFTNLTSADKIFNITFQATSINGCSDDTTKQITVYPKPVVEFIPDPQAQDYNTATDLTEVTFENNTNNYSIWNYIWDFGDGTTSTSSDENVVKDYSIWGDINNENKIPVSLIASNASHPECSDTSYNFIIINPPLPQVELGPDITGCMPLTVEFPSTTKYNYPDSYVWDFGYEGMISDDSNPSSIVYDTAGTYIVRLQVAGDGGTNWDYKTITVYPKPMVHFSFTPEYAWLRSQTEEGTPIKFFNTTKLGESYLWEFGDGNTSSEFQPEHEYLEIGTYYITLIAETEKGCYDTLTHETPVVIDGRGGLQFPNVITIIPNDPADEYYDPGEADPRIFRPVAEGVEEYRLEIYSRWGELIYVSEDVNKGWNGFINGEPAKQDVYVWRVTARFTNGRPYVKAGDVTVLVRQP